MLLAFGLAPTTITWVSAALGVEAHLGTALAIVGVAVGALSFGAFVQAIRRAPPL